MARGAVMIAAIFCETDGPYSGLLGVDLWDIKRDARLYRGPHPVVAHPPCKRWGRYWSGGPSAKVKRMLGDDGGCFAHALWAVRTFGGVLEHPEASHAFRFYGLPIPARRGGWSAPDSYGGRACCVAQSAYGHRAKKLTWLYAAGVSFPELDWSHPSGEKVDAGFHSTAERQAARAAGMKPAKRITAAERLHTPPAFRDLLLSIAASVKDSTPADYGQLDLFGGGHE